MILVVNKWDLYSPEQRTRLLEVLRDERIVEIIPAENVVTTIADPREVEYVIESASGASRSEWRKPDSDVELLKAGMRGRGALERAVAGHSRYGGSRGGVGTIGIH